MSQPWSVWRVGERSAASLVAMLVVLLAPMACGGDAEEADGASAVSGGAVVVAAAEGTSDATVAALAKLLPRQLEDLGVGEGVRREGRDIQLIGSQEIDTAAVQELMTSSVDLEFRPVLETLGSVAPDITPPGANPTNEVDPDVEVVLPDGDGIQYRLGPVYRSGDSTLDGSTVESAVARQNAVGDWVVDPVLREGDGG